MTAKQWAQVREVFEAALERPPQERERFLDAACANSPALRSEVESLLRAHDGAGDFIERPAHQAAPELFLEEEPDSLTGRTIGPYIVRQEIGRGGMGVVYLADDTRLSRRVALKAIAADFGSDQVRRERIRREARAAATLSHPNIATVYALEEIDDELYLACEYVPGPTLRALLANGPLPFADVVDIAAQLARALAAAHAQGVVHGDLKPENVVKTGAGVVKILDFGLALTQNGTGPRATQGGMRWAGTPAYMPPERIRGEAIDFRSDLFSLGVVVYEMAAGENPFEAETPSSTVTRLLDVEPVPLAKARSSEFAPLDRIVAVCLQKQPGRRYESTGRLVAELERLARATATSLEPAREDISAALWWWEFHQVVVSVVYVLALYPAWRAREWLPQPWSLLLLLLASASAAIAATVRLHLWFTARWYPNELTVQRARTRRWTRWSDAGYSVSLLLSALGGASGHPELAMLLLAVSAASAVASFIIEPATTRAAFSRD